MTGSARFAEGASVPRARSDVAVVLLDGEAVIHRHGRVHVLDPVATLVWRSCDGDASVDEIAGDLAEAFATPAATVRRDVGAALEELHALDLLADVDRGAEPDDADSLAMLPPLRDPPGSCATCAERDWALRHSVRVGAHVVAVGANGARADAAIAEALAQHLVPATPTTTVEPPFFALELHDRIANAGPQRLDLLHRGDTVVARSRHPGRVVRALASHLAGYGDLGALGLGAVNGVVVARGDRAMIVRYPADPVRFRHALARHGVLVADGPVALVDPSTGEAVVGAPGLALDFTAIDLLGAEHATGEPEPLPWGRYRVSALGVPEPAGPAVALLALGPDAGDHRDHAGALSAVLALIDAVPVTDAIDPDAISAVLAAG